MKLKYDYIIIGGGSAGCVLANRISSDPKNSVLLIEAGESDWNPLYKIPLMAGVLYRYNYNNWAYSTETQKHLNNRKIFWPRGKVVGGSSSINGMVYTRGLASDYNNWRQLGLKGWSWEDTEKLFIRAEETLSINKPNNIHELTESFLIASKEAGYKYDNNFNSGYVNGLGLYDFTIKNAVRQSTSTAYLNPIKKRKNLNIITKSFVKKINIKNNICTCITFKKDKKEFKAFAFKEVILCAGTVNSPNLLMHSGIGDSKKLKKLSITINKDLPGVGKNLQDHLLVRVQVKTDFEQTLFRELRWDRAIINILKVLTIKKGFASQFPLTSGGFIKSDKNLDEPDLQTHFLPGLSTGKIRYPWSKRNSFDQNGFFANVYQLRPESKGEISISSPDPFSKPLINPNYLESQNDLKTLRIGLKIIRKILTQNSLKKYYKFEIEPGKSISKDFEIDNWIKENADTVFHPVGTCKMGLKSDSLSVVNSNLSVHGISNLKIADASIMPNITSGNTNAPTIMIAEKAAEIILNK